MKKCVMTMLVTAMLLALAVCSAEGWPSADEVRASMWLQNSRDYLSDAGDTVDPAALGKDEYLAPRLFVTNSTGTAQTVSQSWTIDGRAIVFDDKTLKPGRTASWTIDSDAAAAFYTPGSHTLSAVINGQPGYSYTWTVKAAWPAASDISLQLWLQNADKYLSELGTDVNTASFGTDEYAAPRLQLFNNTAAQQTVVMRWDVDGQEITFPGVSTIPVNSWKMWTLSPEDAASFETGGSHTVTAYANGQNIASMTWNVTAAPAWRRNTVITAQLWSKSDEGFVYQFVDDTVDLSDIRENEWLTPVLVLDNQGDADTNSYVVTCAIDGDDPVSWDPNITEPGYTSRLNLNMTTAGQYMTTGAHTAVFYIDGVQTARISWTVTGSRSTKPQVTYSVELWSKNGAGDKVKEFTSAVLDSSELGKNEWLSPMLVIRNDGTAATEGLDISCTIDHTWTSTWSTTTVKAGYTTRLTLSSSNAAHCLDKGHHTAVFFVNGVETAGISWYVGTNPWQCGDVVIELWKQNNDKYLADLGHTVDVGLLGSDEYAAPRVRLFNYSSGSQTVSEMYWTIDGQEITFDGATTIAANDQSGWTLSRDTAEEYYGAGTHRLVIWVNGQQAGAMTWTVVGAPDDDDEDAKVTSR